MAAAKIRMESDETWRALCVLLSVTLVNLGDS